MTTKPMKSRLRNRHSILNNYELPMTSTADLRLGHSTLLIHQCKAHDACLLLNLSPSQLIIYVIALSSLFWHWAPTTDLSVIPHNPYTHSALLTRTSPTAIFPLLATINHHKDSMLACFVSVVLRSSTLTSLSKCFPGNTRPCESSSTHCTP